MSRYDDDFPSARETSSFIARYGIAIVVSCMVVGFAAWGLSTAFWAVTKPIDMTRGVIDRVIDPDHALQTYRWFHDANNQIAAKQGQIALARQALEMSATERKEARRVELLGLQQGCMALVGEYNSKATRADTVIFKHPEKFLPGNWPGERNPLPESINFSVCGE